MREVPEETLKAIERHFHEVIRERAGDLIDKHGIEMPHLEDLLGKEDRKAWFPVPGMYGGFSYWLVGEGEEVKLITESWCRIVDGSGQRHVVTAAGTRLVDAGFV